MKDLSYVSTSAMKAKVVCVCGWESEEFTRGPFDPAEALSAYSVDHLKCMEGPQGLVGGIRLWLWEDAPAQLKILIKEDGDEDGVVWIPTQCSYKSEIDRLWSSIDLSPEIVEFENGTLVVWRHA